MDPLIAALAQLGVSLASSAIYDAAKTFIKRTPGTAPGDLAQALKEQFPSLTLDGASVVAQTVIDFFAERGFIDINGTSIYAANAVWMRSSPGTALTFGHGSTSSTEKTRISAGEGAEARMTGGAQIRQNDDGSITFHV